MSESQKQLVDITNEDFAKYDWIYVGDGIYIQGVEKVDPPNDGYVYVEVTKFCDAKQVWVRAKQYV